MITKPQEYFAPVDRDGFVDYRSLSYTATDSRRYAGTSMKPSNPRAGWEMLKKAGWRIRKVRVSVVGATVYRGK